MTAGAAAQHDVAEAIRAMGPIIQVEPIDFAKILVRTPEPLVIHATYGVFSTKHQYLTSYKGLFFHTRTPTPFPLPEDAELIESKRIWVPSGIY
jgi:hypothetical protein